MIVLISEAAGLKWLTSKLQWTFEKYLKHFILSISCKKHTRIYVLCIKLSKDNWLIKAIQIFRQFKKGSNCLAAMHSGFSKANVPWDLYSEKLGSYRKSLKKVGLIRVWNVWRVKKGSPSWNSCHAPFCIDFWKYKIMQMLIDLTHNEIIDLTLLAQLLFDSYRQFQKLNFSKNLPNLFAVKDFLFLDILESLKTWFLTLTYFEQLKTLALGILCWVQWGF